MAELSYKITGDNSGLLSATNAAIANIQNLTDAVSGANASLQFKNGIAALDTLGQKLLVVQGNSSLFGDSVKLQTQAVDAYKTALNGLLANGFEPMDGDVQRLKSRIDELTTSLQAVNNVQPRKTVFEPGGAPSAENIQGSNTGSVAEQSQLITALNQQLKDGVITLQQYNDALLSANRTTAELGQGTQATSEVIAEQDGYITGLTQQLKELNQLRFNAPAEDLAYLNSQIQQTEVALQQATNIGKVGFDQFGNSIKGVSLQNVNGQLISLSNNLFGARQIARDLARAFTSDSLAGTVKNVTLLAVDFLFYAQNAAFATGATTAATTAIAAEGTVATGTAFSIEALGVAFVSLLTPLNLIVLGVAVAAGGFEAYEKSQKTATQAATAHLKALQAQKQALADYLTTLNASQQVEAASAENYAKSVLKLDELYYAVKNNTGALFDGKTALADLQEIYPAFFANIDTAKSKTDALTIAYNGAKEALIALGTFTAANTLAESSIETAIKNQVALNNAKGQENDLILKITAAQKNIDDLVKANPSVAATQFGTSGLTGYENQLDDLKSKLRDTHTDALSFADALGVANKQAQAFYDIANKNAPKAGKATVKPDKTGSNTTDPFDTILNSLTEIANKTKALGNESGLTGYALDVQKITDKYIVLNQQLDEQQAKLDKANKATNITPADKIKSGNDQSLLNKDRTSVSLSEQKELSDAAISEAQRISNEIQRINDEFGVHSEQSRQKELSLIQQHYDAEVVKARGNVQILEALENDKTIAVQAINDKYFQQEVDLYNKINTLNDQATDEENSNRDNETARINKTFADRFATVNSYFEKVRAASKTGNNAVDDFNNLIIGAQQSAVVTNLSKDQQQQIQLSISKPLIQGIDQAAASFYTTLTQINQQTDQSFKAIFADLTKSLNTSMNSIFLNIVEKGLETALQNAIKNGTSTLFNSSGGLTTSGAEIAGAGLAGGLISGATSQTSTVGQAAGGALSGAASGAALGATIGAAGGPIGIVGGAVIGGAIGIISGIFSASKAQKALQEQQLQQAQEQTALLKASLAYTSQIIGRDTANGVVTNITVGATGQLVATVSGKDLQFILNRNANVR